MSLQGNIAIQGFCEELLKQVAKWEKECPTKEDFIKALRKEVGETIKACEGGWY